jgi:predicted ATP-dependent endonuclease of OLD family
MRVESLYLRGVRGLLEIKLDFVDKAVGQIRQRTVIAGSNGTGKTTILEVICALLEMAKGVEPKWLDPNRVLAGIAVWDWPLPYGYPELNLWVGNELPKQHVDIAYVSERYDPHKKSGSDTPVISYIATQNFPNEIARAEGSRYVFANCVYFPSEGRELQPKQTGQVRGELRSAHWVYRFSDSSRWEGSLESSLVAMDYRDLMAQREGKAEESEFQQFVKIINRFLRGKRIAGVDQESFRVQVQADNGQDYSIDNLSSGEKQILLMLGEIQRHLRRGGVLLIDEPEIHLHPKWQRMLVRALTDSTLK